MLCKEIHQTAEKGFSLPWEHRRVWFSRSPELLPALKGHPWPSQVSQTTLHFSKCWFLVSPPAWDKRFYWCHTWQRSRCSRSREVRALPASKCVLGSSWIAWFCFCWYCRSVRALDFSNPSAFICKAIWLKIITSSFHSDLGHPNLSVVSRASW